jgi:ankyrin repeat protein
MEMVRARPGLVPRGAGQANLLLALQMGKGHLNDDLWRLEPFLRAWSDHVVSDEPGALEVRSHFLDSDWYSPSTFDPDNRHASDTFIALPLRLALNVWGTFSPERSVWAALDLWRQPVGVHNLREQSSRGPLPPGPPNALSACIKAGLECAMTYGTKVLLFARPEASRSRSALRNNESLERATLELFGLACKGGLDLEAPLDEAGHTLLHLAAVFGSTDRVLMLLDAGASIDALDSGGLTPGEFARTAGRIDTADLLQAVRIKRGLTARVAQAREARRGGPGALHGGAAP